MNLVRKKLQHSLHNKQCFIATLFCFYDYNAATTADVRIVYITNLLNSYVAEMFGLYIINKKIKVEMEMKRIYVKPHVEQHRVLTEKLLTKDSDQGDHAESKPHDNTLWEQDEEWTNKFENKSKRGKNIK